MILQTVPCQNVTAVTADFCTYASAHDLRVLVKPRQYIIVNVSSVCSLHAFSEGNRKRLTWRYMEYLGGLGGMVIKGMALVVVFSQKLVILGLQN